MQADPFVQAPTNLQNYNAYSYVLNNPLSYTDPSGYFFKKLAGTLLSRKGAQMVGFSLGGLTGAWLGRRAYDRIMGSEGLQTVVAVALNFVPGCQVWCSALFSAQVNYYHTGNVGSALRAGATSAATAYAFSAIGDYYKGEYGSFAGAEFGEQLQWAGSHALVGGVSSVASGGKFGHGFISAGFTKMVMGNAGFNMNNRDWDAIVGRTTVAAIVGGTASALTGGKFANGARTAAMMHALNAEAPSSKRFRSTKLRGLDVTKEQAEEMVNDIELFVNEHYPEMLQTTNILFDLGVGYDFAFPTGHILLDYGMKYDLFQNLVFHEKLHVYMFQELGGFLNYQNASNVNDIHLWIRDTAAIMGAVYRGRSMPLPNLKDYPKPVYEFKGDR
ncbi:hypothetical protein N475_25675 [Pseudoalteromonas luteoviolacea DSM 6061]|uniref:Uncharacterized protein n=2 Tax=Pseudoalteromonas luteoviolacea TaxID=43657 RepID=A0A167BDL8_9GAMM|nr:hypothetical protein N475_25675 [Pseudoalteromonas luteoviolacea DSM 6061]